MLHFRSQSEAVRAPLASPVKAVVVDRIEAFQESLKKLGEIWVPEDDGHFVFANAEEADLPLRDFGWDLRLRDLQPEVVRYHAAARLWEVVHIPCNSWGWTCFLPDSPVLPHEVRAWLLENASEADAALARRTRA